MSYCLQQPQQQIHPQNDSSLWFDPNQSYPAQSVTIEGHQQPTANPLTYGHDHFTETEPKSKQVLVIFIKNLFKNVTRLLVFQGKTLNVPAAL